MCILKIYFNFYVYVGFTYLHMCGMSVPTVPRGHLIIYTHLCCVCMHVSGVSAHTAIVCAHLCVVCVCVFEYMCLCLWY